MKHYYISHLGEGLFSTAHKLSDEELYCEECGDLDEYLGKFASDEDAAKAYADYRKRVYGDDSPRHPALQAFDMIKDIELSHMTYDSDENYDGEWEYEAVEVDDGTIEDNYPDEVRLVRDTLVQVDNITSRYDLTMAEIDEILAETIGVRK